MAKYAQYDDVVNRYPRATKKGGKEEMVAFINVAENEIEGMFAGRYTLPFSSNNVTVKDLVVGSGLVFDDRGNHSLKGVPDEWQIFSVL